jgi:2-C-methyl-D-erythritol 4-phosphate cytidylyltransferase
MATAARFVLEYRLGLTGSADWLAFGGEIRVLGDNLMGSTRTEGYGAFLFLLSRSEWGPTLWAMVSAVIVAAGKGNRMGPGIDKLFLPVHGRPVVAHTWAAFERADCIDEVVLVVRDGLQEEFKAIQERYNFAKPSRFVAGGKERQDSVWSGLQAVSAGCQIVAIQDGARPCTTVELIAATVQAAREWGAAVAAQPVTDTIKESTDGRLVKRTLDRSVLWGVQTPQTFRLELIRRALTAVREKKLTVTDDTAACELIGEPVVLVSGTRPNPKVTRPEDLAYIEVLLKESRR